MNINNLRLQANDEAACWEYVKELRAKFSSCVSYWERDKRMTANAAFSRGTGVIQEMLRYLQSQHFDVRELKPGHGIGHMARNYTHAHLLLSRLEGVRPPDLFIGLIAGTLHDLGCLFINRADEWSRVVKHAELGAMVFHEIFKEETFGLSKSEQLTIEYAVAAHTNFMKPQMVRCSDGIIRRSRPYDGAYFDYGIPYMAIHFPRFVDRLDFTHPLSLGRRLLEEASRYKDAYAEREKFIETMRIGGARKTRPTHYQRLNEFAESNMKHSASPFIKHDFGFMIVARLDYNHELQGMLDAIDSGTYSGDESALRCSWGDFLEKNVEPTELGRAAASKLFLLLNELPPSIHRAWCAGFAATLESYSHHGATLVEQLGKLPPEWLNLPGVADDVRDIIAPHYAWPPEVTGG